LLHRRPPHNNRAKGMGEQTL